MPEGAGKPEAFPADSIIKTELSPGVRNGTVWGDRIMLSFVDFEPHSVVDEHSHQHEQMGAVLEGTDNRRQDTHSGGRRRVPGSRKRAARRAQRP